MNFLYAFVDFATSRLWFVIPLIVGCLTYWWLLRFMSISTGVSWDEIWNEIKRGNLAAGVYFGCRAVAVAIVAGLVSIASAIATVYVIR